MPLKRTEKAAIKLLADGLRKHFGDNLFQVLLFGSKARGDDDPSSDLDVLVVLKKRPEGQEHSAMTDIVYEVLETSGVFVQTVVLSRSQFEHPTGQLRWLTSFVQEEGVVL